MYEDSLGKAGENFGPGSKETKMALRALDNDIQFLQQRLLDTNMEGYVNIIITSDHGITTRPTGDKQIEIGLVLRRAGLVRDVKMIVGSGAYSMIYPREDPQQGVLEPPTANNDRRNRIVRQLGISLKNQADVYKKEDVPEHLHWKV